MRLSHLRKHLADMSEGDFLSQLASHYVTND